MAFQDWSLRNFSDGLIDSIDDTLLPDGAAKDCQNFISRTIGTLQKRTGQTRLNPSLPLTGAVQGLYAYYHGEALTTRRLIVSAGGTVAWWNFVTSTWTQLRTGQSTLQPFLFETLVHAMVCFNGVNIPWTWNGSVVADLTNAPADGRYPVLHQEKLFVTRVLEPSTLRWSDSFQPNQWPTVNFWQIKMGDGDEITCLRSHLGQLIIFKNRSLHTLQGFSLDDFRLEELDDRIGCVGPLAASALGPHLYFVSHEGLHVFNGVRSQNLSVNAIPQLWSRVNRAQIHRATVTVWDNVVWFALPEGTSTVNNLVIAYRIPEGNRVGSFWVWRGVNASCFQIFDNGQQIALYSGDSLSGFVNRQDVGTDDFGTPIQAFWQGKSFDQGTAEREKKAIRAFVEDSATGENRVNLEVSLNYTPFQSLQLVTSNPMVRAFRLPQGAWWRYIQLRFVHNQLGSCEVRGLLIPFKTKEKPRA